MSKLSQSRIFIPRQQNEVRFDIFGEPRKQDIRVGYIHPTRGYVTGVTICEANTHAKNNPGAQFILKNRDKVRFMNINDVNNLTANTAYHTSGLPKDGQQTCGGITFNEPQGPPVVEFMGGGGVGAKGNPVVGTDGAVMAVHLVEGGFGYQYPPLIDIQEHTGIGAGVVAEAILGEVNLGFETYGEESDIEDYFPIRTTDGANLKSICSGGVSDVPYGYTYNLNGKKLNEWDPTIYANLEENLFRRRILEYQEYLANLRTPWFATRYKGNTFAPSQISSDGGLVNNPEYLFEVRKQYPSNKGRVYAVQHQAWGGYDVRNLDADINAADGNKSTDKELVNITFDVFVHVAHSVRTGGGGLRFKFTEVLDRQAKPEQGRYGKHTFTIKCTDVTDVNTKDRGKWDEIWDSEGVQSVTKKIKADTLYEVQSLGSHGGKNTQQGLIKSLGYNAQQISLEDEYDQQIGTKIYADLLGTNNDNDDIQIGARKGKFTAEGKWYTSDGTTQNFPESHFTHNSDGTWSETWKTKGVDTYDLYFTVTRKELEDTAGVTDDLFATEQEGSVTQSFMNKYAISPVPMSNELGSDYANQLFTMEWDMLFPYPGEYTFIGQTDNECKFYMDGQLVGDLSTWNTAPWVLKRNIQWPTDPKGDNGKLHTIRLDLVNTPKVEGVTVQQKDGQIFVAEDTGDNFKDVTFDGYSNIPTLPTTNDGGDTIDVTFKSTSSAGCTNRFYLTPLGGGDKRWIQCGYGNGGWNSFMRDYAAFVETGGGEHSYTAYWTPNGIPGASKDFEDPSELFLAYQTDGHGSIEVSGPGLRNYQNIGDNPPDFKITSGGNWNNTLTRKFGVYEGKVVHIKLTVANANGVNDPNFGPDPGGIAVRIYDKNGKTVWSTKEIFDSYSGGARAEGEIVLVRNDQKTATLRSGVDYGVRMTTTCNTNMPGAEMVENGTKLLYEDLGMSGDYNDLIVTCSKGKFRSKDGTDDTGKFGHNGKMIDQILWSVPKIEPGAGLSGGGDNMQFNFAAQDGTHSFSITAKEIQKSPQLTKSVKSNTVYNVKATVLHDAQDRMEQGPSKTPGSTGFIDGDFHQAWESKQQIGSLHKLIHGSLIGATPATNIQVLASKGNFKLTRKYRHPFIPQNVSDFSWAQKKKGEGLQTYDITYEHVVDSPPFTPTGSTSSEIQTKNIFATDTHQNDANRQLWRTNVYDKGGFLMAHGICPFPVKEDVDTSLINDNPYAGEHKIIWNNVNFPVSASYNVRVAVDDSVILDFEGPDGTTRIEKNGFVNGQSTGDSLYTQWFDKGSYKLTAVLTQKEGGRFGFKALTDAEKLARRKRIFDDLFVPEPPPPTTSEVTFKTTSSAGFTNSVAIAGVCTLTRNASATKTIEIGKNYTVAFSSSGGNDRVRLKLSSDKRTVFMEDLTDGDFNDLVLTITGGKFHGIFNNRFLTYEGGVAEGGAGSGQPPAPRFPQSVDDIKLKGINPMALAIDIKVSYGTAQRVSAQSWYENPMGVAFNIRAPLAPPPVEDEPKSEGRCPNNPLWTTRFASNSQNTWYPCYSKISDFDKTSLEEHNWGEFMNKYAMSPVPPKSSKGSDEGGKWYENTWSVEIPYDGWYTFKMCSDDESEFYVDGVKIDELTNPGWIQERQKTIFIAQGSEPSEFRVRVKNRSTTKMRTINKKIFSARDWVKEGGATDEGFEPGDNDPHKFKDVKFDLFTLAQTDTGVLPGPPIIGGDLDVTFTSTSAAGCTNRFFVVERGAPPANTNEIEWLNMHSRNFPLSNRLNRNKTGITFLDEHGGDSNGWANITSGNAKFSDDASKLVKIGSGSNTVTISYGWKDGGRNHGDGFVINGVEWNNKAPGYSDRGSITKDVELGSAGDGFKQLAMLERNDQKTVTLESGKDYGVYFTTTCNTDPMGCEITNNGTRILIEDLGVRTPTDDMVVTVSAGKFRSKDGTDDWGLFGHPNYGKLKDQILWSVPKIEKGTEIPQDWNTKDIRFTFSEKGGGHSFEIRGGEVGNIRKNEDGIFEGTGVVTKRMKLNTKYTVRSSIRSLTGRDDQDKMDQGFTKHLGRVDYGSVNGHQQWENSHPVGSKWKYIFGDALPRQKRIITKPDPMVTFNVTECTTGDTANNVDSKFVFDFNGCAGSPGTYMLTAGPGSHSRAVKEGYENGRLCTHFTDSSGSGTGTTGYIRFSNNNRTIDFIKTGSTALQSLPPTVSVTCSRGTWSGGSTTNSNITEQGKWFKYSYGKASFSELRYLKWNYEPPGETTEEDGLFDVGGDLQIGATEGSFLSTNRRRHGFAPEGGTGVWTYDLEYEIPWEPPVVVAKDLTRRGTTREGITYGGPYLFSYLERDWGSVMNKYAVSVIEKETQDLSVPNDNILGTKTLSWSNVPFEHEGNYEAVFIADDNAKFFINDEEVLVSKQGKFSDEDAVTRIFSIRTAGHYSIRIELENTPTHSPVFFDNPTGVVLEITKPLDIPTYDADGIINSESWTKNPMGVSAECIPPPCSKLLDGKGVVDDVIIIDPGNKYPKPPEGETPGSYPVVNEITDFVIVDPGINYPKDTVAKVDFGVGDPIETPVELGPFGKITGISWPPPFEGGGTPTPPPPVTQWPSITFGPPTITSSVGGGIAGEQRATSEPAGVNGRAVPVIKPTVLLPDDINPTTGLPIPSNQLIQVTDLVGLKQTGWYNGKEYYGAVFYKDGVRYAGYYETAGVLIRVYSTKQESIDSQVTTPPSAILRQGTDVSSNDPRLNIPGTPQ